MADYDAVIIGGGPAGLTAGLYLGRANLRVILLEKENYGGTLKEQINWIENYPGFPEGVSGAQLASDMMTQATNYGMQSKLAEVTKLEFYSSSKWVHCADGTGYTTNAVIIAGGSHPLKLNVPGEDELTGKGVFTCALCDGGEYRDKVVVVRGGGDTGVTEALYLANIAAKVVVIASNPKLTACAVLQERALSNPKMEVRCGTEIEAIKGTDKVEAVDIVEKATGKKETLEADGVLVHIGTAANTDYLPGNIPLDDSGQVIVNDRMETEVPGVYGAGDVRSGSSRQVSTAVGDGATAAIAVMRYLQSLG